jgi:hypothetical protein
MSSFDTQFLPIHGHAYPRTPTYRSWEAMKRRCNSDKHIFTHQYKGRGISFDPRWAKFENFLEDMGVRPQGSQLDRIDNNGNYCKENCRWVDAKTNSRNRRSGKLNETQVSQIKDLLHENTMTQKQIADLFNVSPSLVSAIKKGIRWG